MDETTPSPADGPRQGPDLLLDGPGEATPRDLTEIRDPLPQPLFSWRRLAIAAALALAVGCLVVAAQSGGGGGSERHDDQPAIVSFDPSPGSRVIRQSTVGVVLEQGYDGRLVIGGTAIPEEQMEGAIVPGSEAYATLTPEERQSGPRPNNKEQVRFRPGPGQAVTEFPTGELEITVRYWRRSAGEASAQTFTYVIYTI